MSQKQVTLDNPLDTLEEAAPTKAKAFPVGNYVISLETLKKLNLSLHDALEQLECALVVESIEQHKGNFTQAAKTLGLNRTTFMMKIRKLRQYGIEPKAYRAKFSFNS